MTTTLEDLRESFGTYFLANNLDYKYVRFQQETIAPALDAVARGELKRLMILMPPGFGKSDLGTRNFIPFWMGLHPQENAMVCSYAASLASDDFGSKVKERLSNPLHKMIFPDSEITRDSRSKTLIRTIKGGTFYSVGFGGAIAGKRCNLILLDDLIKNDDEADSEPTQDKLFQTYGSVIKARLRPGGAIVFLMTRWRMRDIAGRILEAEGRVENGGDWTVLTLKAQNDDGSYLWDFYPDSHYEQAKRFEDSWQGLWQQDPQGSRSLWFKRDWLEFYDVAPPRGKFHSYMITDPAMGTGKTSDRTCSMVLDAGPDERYILVDWILDRLDPGTRCQAILAQAQRSKPKQWIYEEIGLNSDTYFLRKMMSEKDVRFYPQPVGRHGARHLMSKELRIKELVPLFFDRKIVLPRKYLYTNSEGKRVDLVEQFLTQEYDLYKGKGSVKHDDCLDTLSRIREPELVWRFHRDTEEKVEPRRSSKLQATTWESYW